jgi:DNA-binding transcriptional MerR regulator
MSEPARLTFREIVADSGLSKRTVRYYIHEGLVPPAIGRGRSAYYTPAHMQRLARIRAWQVEHRSLDEMRQLLLTERAAAPPALDSERWTRIRLHDDLELHVRQDASAQIHALVEQLCAATDAWFYGTPDE